MGGEMGGLASCRPTGSSRDQRAQCTFLLSGALAPKYLVALRAAFRGAGAAAEAC